MDEILALQRQLADVQVSSSASRLSERNCVELVAKLQSLSLVDLIFTRTGKEYLTPAQLEREVEDEILVRGGRVNVIDIPDALNVDLVHVQAALPKVIANAPCATRVVNGEVVTDDYLATLAADVDAALAESASGVDTIGEIASRTSLPVAVIRECITCHLGTVIRATIDDASGELRSYVSLERAVAISRGALRAAVSPTVLVDLADRHDVPEEIVMSTASNMLKAKALAGRIEGTGTRAVFLPYVFERAARASALAGFAGDGFLSREKLRSLSISDPVAFVRENVPGALVLGSIVVGPSLLETLKGSASETLECESWLDIGAALPPSFPEDHVAYVVDLLEHTGKRDSSALASSRGKATGKRRAVSKPLASQQSDDADQDSSCRVSLKLDGPVLAGRFLVSPALLEKCRAVVKRDACKRARVRAEAIYAAASVVGASADDQQVKDELDKPRKAKPRRRKDKQAASGNTGSDRFRGYSVSVDIPSLDDVCTLLKEDETIVDTLDSDYLGNSSVDIDVVLHCIVSEGMDERDDGGVTAMYETSAAAAVVVYEKELAAARLELEHAIISSLERAEIYQNNSSTLSNASEDAVEMSRQHILRTHCRLATLSILNFILRNAGVTADLNTEKDDDFAPEITRLQSMLPTDLAAKVKPITSCVTGKKLGDVVQFLAAYDDATAELDLPPRRPLDKKRERATNALLRNELEGQLQAGSESNLTCVQALSICATLLHARCYGGAVVSIPVTLVPTLCDALEGGELRSDDARTALSDFRSAVTAELRAAAESSDTPALSEDLQRKLDAVTAFLILNQ